MNRATVGKQDRVWWMTVSCVVLQLSLLASFASGAVKERVYPFGEADDGAVVGGVAMTTADIVESDDDNAGGFVDLGAANAAESPTYAIGREGAGSLALDFDGNDDLMTAASFDPRNFGGQFAVISQGWVRPDSDGQGDAQYLWNLGTDLGGVGITEDGFWEMRSIQVLPDTATEVAVDFDAWTHLAVFRTGGNANLFVNGARVLRLENFWNGPGEVAVGSGPSGENPYAGLIDDFNLAGFSDGTFDVVQDIDFFDPDNFSGVDGDVDQDGVVNQADYLIWSASVGFDNGLGAGDASTLLLGDVTGNGKVNYFDFQVIRDEAAAAGEAQLGERTRTVVHRNAGVRLLGVVPPSKKNSTLSRRAPFDLVADLATALLGDTSMNRNVLWIFVLTVAASCWGVPNLARSEVIVTEDFFYNQPTNELGVLGVALQGYAGGQNGAAGQWTGPWGSSGEAVITGPDYVEEDDQFQGIGGDLGIPVNANYMQRGYQTNGLAADQTLYFSIKARVDADRINQPRMWLEFPEEDEEEEFLEVGMGFVNGGFVASLGDDFEDNLDEVTNDGDFHQLVGKLEVNAVGNNERLTVWYDPSGNEVGETAVVESNVVSSIQDLSVVRLGRLDESCCGASGLIYWDDVAVGTTWDDVAEVSVPRLTLQIDPGTGAASLVNTTDEVFEMTYYEINSESGALRVDEWNSLDDQNTSEGGWLENSPNSNQLIESNFAGITDLAGGQSLALGAPFDPAGAQDLVARVATDRGLLNVAVVEYGPLTGLTGDFNMNGVLDLPDIDDLTAQSASGTNPASYDLTDDGLVDEADVAVWVKDLYVTWIGDANLSGEFDTADLLDVFAAGDYDIDVDSVWSAQIAFNGDGRFNSDDLLAAFADGGYLAGPAPGATAAVPEPSSLVLALFAGLLVTVTRRRRAK